MAPRIAVVSTYKPTNCGIATFTQSLLNAMNGICRTPAKVVRLIESKSDEVESGSEVICTITEGNPLSMVNAANKINEMDVVLIQHEFGIYGGFDGDEVITLIEKLVIPSIVVLHTVLSSPTPHQRAVLLKLCQRATAVVVMSQIAVNRLMAEPDVDSSKIFLFQHGARSITTNPEQHHSERPIILTWGLISPGKGVEWVIKSMDFLRDIEPRPLYVVSGRTHPKVLEHDGERYRESLQKLIEDLDLAESVQLRPNFLENVALDHLIAASTLVVLPYDNSEQVTSGVLMEAVSAGRPIVATRFPHAVELLQQDVGILVPYRDPAALANAIRRIITAPELAAEMSHRTKAIARNIQWPVVAQQYLQLISNLAYERASA